jgi:hypothetical protein
VCLYGWDLPSNVLGRENCDTVISVDITVHQPPLFFGYCMQVCWLHDFESKLDMLKQAANKDFFFFSGW